MSDRDLSHSSLPGIQGSADKRAVVDVANLPRYEESDRDVSMEREAPPFMPIPHDFPETDADDPTVTPGSGGVTSTTLEAPPGVTQLAAEPTLTAKFDAVTYNGIPVPDAHGAAGRNHLVAAHNGTVSIQSLGGEIVSTVSLDAFWAAAGGGGGSGTFDPKVLYDRVANRWIMTACDDARLDTSSVLIGVSQTADPTGAWNTYKVAIAGPDQAWADYPSIGFNSKWIVVQVNMYVGSTFARSHVYAFDKADLYARGPGSFTWWALVNHGGTQVPAVVEDEDFDELYLLQAGNSNSSGQGFLRVYRIYGPVHSEWLSRLSPLSIDKTWDPEAPGGADFAPQLGLPQRIQVNDDRIQNVVQSHETLYAAHTILLPAGGSPSRSAIQWWRIDANGDDEKVIECERIDDATGNVFRAFPSIGITLRGGILVGYSSFSASQFPSAKYAYRTWNAPKGTPLTEKDLKDGEGPYHNTRGAGRNRWGDYTSTVRSPGVAGSAIWTIQEYARPAVGSGDGSGRWGTYWGQIEFFDD